MMAIKAALEKQGHVMNVYEVGKESQKEIIREQHKKDHRKQYLDACKDISHGTPTPAYNYEEPPDMFNVLDDYPDDAKFLYGYEVVFSHAKAMHPLLKTVHSCDGAFLKGEEVGTTFGFWGQDANSHILCLAFAVYFDNESGPTWNRFLGTLKQNIPTVDDDKNCVIAGEYRARSRVSLRDDMLAQLSNSNVDHDKGFNKEFPVLFKHAHSFECSKHKGDNLEKKGTKGDRAVYEEAIRATSAEALEIAKKKYSRKGAVYMADTPDDRLYLYAAGQRNCGKTSSQVSESSNAANIQMRGNSIASGCLLFFEQEMTQVLAHKEKAESYPGPLTPFAEAMVREMDTNATMLFGGGRSVDSKPGGWHIVHSSNKGKSSYIVRGLLECTCGLPAITTYSCDHERDAARASNKDMEGFFQEKEKVSTWKKQYSVVSTDSLVATNEVYKEFVGPHRMPVVFKKPKGQPKANKRKMSGIEIAKMKKAKKEKTCWYKCKKYAEV
jgi:hypothetical protein